MPSPRINPDTVWPNLLDDRTPGDQGELTSVLDQGIFAAHKLHRALVPASDAFAVLRHVEGAAAFLRQFLTLLGDLATRQHGEQVGAKDDFGSFPLHQILLDEPLLTAIKSAADFVAKAGIDTRHRCFSEQLPVQPGRAVGRHLSVQIDRREDADAQLLGALGVVVLRAAQIVVGCTITNKAEAAYRRGDLFEKRNKLMAARAGYCSTPKAEKIVPLRKGQARSAAAFGRPAYSARRWLGMLQGILMALPVRFLKFVAASLPGDQKNSAAALNVENIFQGH
jgi:hypothetical protein